MYSDAKSTAASYNRMLLRIHNGEDSEYESLEAYIESLGAGYSLIQQVDFDGGRENKYYTGVSLMLAGGGPTVWINTSDGCIFASGSDGIAGVGLFSEVSNEINDLFGIEY